MINWLKRKLTGSLVARLTANDLRFKYGIDSPIVRIEGMTVVGSYLEHTDNRFRAIRRR